MTPPPPGFFPAWPAGSDTWAGSGFIPVCQMLAEQCRIILVSVDQKWLS
jgi:hypothetical protein